MSNYSSNFSGPSLNTRNIGDMRQWSGAQNMPTFNASPSKFDSGRYGANFNSGNGSSLLESSDRVGGSEGIGGGGLDFLGDDTPGKEGAWTSGVGMALDVAGVGLDVYNALEQSKMNKFMRSYYGDQMDMQKTDFANAAKGTNEALAGRARTRASAAGHSFDSAENKAQTSSYMDQWGMQETY